MDFLDKKTWHRLGPPFANLATVFKIRVTEEDIEYINNVIKKDKVYSLINTRVESPYPRNSKDTLLLYAYGYVNTIVFYEGHYNSPICPKGVKQILFAHIGLLRSYIEEAYPNLLEYRRSIVERWFEIAKSNN